ELEIWRKRWWDIGNSTQPADRPRAEAAITRLYELIDQPKPEFHWVQSPQAATKLLTQMSGNSTQIEYGQPFWGSHEVYWIAYYLFAREVLGEKYTPEKNEQLDLWSEIGQSCGWWYPYEGFVVAVERPSILAWDTSTE